MIKVALIGIGGMGGVHFNCYKNIADAEVIAVCDVRTDMAKEKVGGEGINIYESIDDLLVNEKPDIADICTPSYMHREMSIKALEHGINVLSEKPMSLSSADTQAVTEAVKRSGKLFMTAHVVRFMTPYIYLKNVINSKEYGELLRLDMKRISAIPTWSWQDWMRDLKKSGGTPIDLSIHDIDFVQYVLGEPKEVRGVYHKLKNNNDYIISELVYDKCIVSAEATWYNYNIPFEASFKAVFENGAVEYKGEKIFANGNEIELTTEALSSDTGINISGVDGYVGEIEYFVSCVKNGTKPQIVTPESSQASVRLVERILENSIII
ncbi:MAG: Gfo/Idh/MocA family oxidoreductase [Firmicutes bacterium]|nr:Gfo/Idh/MocA family oxidoreductase [Bacillota bacterium]